MIEQMIFTIIGAVVGSVVTSIIHILKSTSGTLRIDHSNPKKDTYRFEIDKLDDLAKAKRIVLKIDNDADLSQK